MSSTPNLILTLSCPDQPGIVSAVAGAIADRGGNIIQSQQFGDELTGLFFMRVEISDTSLRVPLENAMTDIAAKFDMTWNIENDDRRMRTILMASREGHCLNDLLIRQRTQGLPIDVAAIVSNHEDLRDIADFYQVPFHYVPVTAETKPQAEAELLRLVDELDVELVVLARYMQILSDEVCQQLSGRIINIHHSFLPSFKGGRPYAQAHNRGVKLIGATAHYVTSDLDEGPIIEQEVERIDHSFDVAEMVSIGQDVERRTLARAVRWHAEHRVLANGLRTVVFR